MENKSNIKKWIASNPQKINSLSKIEESIESYSQNATRKGDDYIIAHLRLIGDLARNIEKSEDKMFIDKIIDTFSEIITVQREVISNLEYEAENNYAYIPQAEAVQQEDIDMQTSFSNYLIQKGKSSYTINDYCLRIKKLWKSFYDEYSEGKLPEDFQCKVKEIPWDDNFMNAYDHAETLDRYVTIKISESGGSRNWANIRSAFNSFYEFVTNVEK